MYQVRIRTLDDLFSRETATKPETTYDGDNYIIKVQGEFCVMVPAGRIEMISVVADGTDADALVLTSAQKRDLLEAIAEMRKSEFRAGFHQGDHDRYGAHARRAAECSVRVAELLGDADANECDGA